MKYILPLLFLPTALLPPTEAQGVSAPWDISQTLSSLSEQTQRLTPVLDQLKPEQWEAKGAPAAYTSQWRNARSEVGYLLAAAQTLRKQPEKLTLALETLFRLQAVESQINSLVDAVRRAGRHDPRRKRRLRSEGETLDAADAADAAAGSCGGLGDAAPHGCLVMRRPMGAW